MKASAAATIARGCFEVSGESARLQQLGGWLVATTPTHRDEASLFRAQPQLLAPVKAMRGGRLRAEVPCRRDVGASFLLVHAALETSLRQIAGIEHTPARACAPPPGRSFVASRILRILLGGERRRL